MKKLFVVGLVMGLVGMGGMVYAAVTADVTVTVKVQKLSVGVSPSSYDFGTMVANTNSVASSQITVTNDGNVTEKFQLSIPAEPNTTWASVTATTPGAEKYRISGIFKTAAPVSGNFLASDSFSVSTVRVATATDLALDADADGQKGFNVTQSDTRNLWFKLEAPSATALTTQQSITVRLTAQP